MADAAEREQPLAFLEQLPARRRVGFRQRADAVQPRARCGPCRARGRLAACDGRAQAARRCGELEHARSRLSKRSRRRGSARSMNFWSSGSVQRRRPTRVGGGRRRASATMPLRSERPADRLPCSQVRRERAHARVRFAWRGRRSSGHGRTSRPRQAPGPTGRRRRASRARRCCRARASRRVGGGSPGIALRACGGPNIIAGFSADSAALFVGRPTAIAAARDPCPDPSWGARGFLRNVRI